MPPARISDSQMELLATRLAAVGVGRRDFLRVAAGLATMGAAGFNARPVLAAPKLAPGEKLARGQHVRIGGCGWGQNDPSSPQYNKELYCTGVAPVSAGLVQVNRHLQSRPHLDRHAKADGRSSELDPS